MRTVAAALLFVSTSLLSAQSTVPIVSCPSDGQQGPQPGPKVEETERVRLAPNAAARLALYKFEEDPGILGPRGWHCLELSGSNGSTLYMTPTELHTADILSDSFKGFRGPAIQFSVSIGDTSGRFEVAKIIARVFPTHRDFVRRVIAEKIEPATNFPYGPYPHDKLTYRGKNEVFFTTPPNTEGLGTNSRLAKSPLPIRGVAFLSPPELDLTYLALRLSAQDSDLTSLILHSVQSRHH